jgi:hypothetical protein
MAEHHAADTRTGRLCDFGLGGFSGPRLLGAVAVDPTLYYIAPFWDMACIGFSVCSVINRS